MCGESGARHRAAFFAAGPPPIGFVGWSIAWVAIVLGLAAWSLGRDL